MVIAGFLLLAVIASIFIVEDLRRLKADDKTIATGQQINVTADGT
jgi:hypothetical protein